MENTANPKNLPSGDVNKIAYSYCSLPDEVVPTFGPDVNSDRARLIRLLRTKWVNATVLHYYFFDQESDGQNVVLEDGTSRFVPWTTTEPEKDVVRKAFDLWKEVGIGLRFEEVRTREEAEIRIGFMRNDGAWSYIGRDILAYGKDHRTMNFGWDLTRDPSELDTAIHEIGHSLGFPHEHQNPNAGIVWDEEAVYAALAKPPNRWKRETTFHNIIRKIEPDAVQGSSWDPDSVMHYPFQAGLVKEPKDYRQGIFPKGGLSPRDITWVQSFYPALMSEEYPVLKPFVSASLVLQPGEQKNFRLDVDGTRQYEIRTFGTSDTVMVLFEEIGGELKYVTADDDSGEDRNSYIKVKLFKGKKYTVRVRMYYADSPGETAIMLW